jgi:hypothetical protein
MQQLNRLLEIWDDMKGYSSNSEGEKLFPL